MIRVAEILKFASSGEYRDERLYLLATLERLEKKQDDQSGDLAVAKADTAKARTDLNEAHGRIRMQKASIEKLDRRLLRMELRAGSIATLVGLVTAGAIEALKHHFAK